MSLQTWSIYLIVTCPMKWKIDSGIQTQFVGSFVAQIILSVSSFSSELIKCFWISESIGPRACDWMVANWWKWALVSVENSIKPIYFVYKTCNKMIQNGIGTCFITLYHWNGVAWHWNWSKDGGRWKRFNEFDSLLLLLVPFQRWMVMLPLFYFAPFRFTFVMKSKDLFKTKWSHKMDYRFNVKKKERDWYKTGTEVAS